MLYNVVSKMPVWLTHIVVYTMNLFRWYKVALIYNINLRFANRGTYPLT